MSIDPASDDAPAEPASLVDLAFLRALVDDGGAALWSGGAGMLAAGGIFGSLSLAGWLSAMGVIPSGIMIALSAIAIAAFCATAAAIGWRLRGARKGGSGRTLASAIEGGGIAVGVLALVFIIVALRRGDPTIWFLHPIVLCAVQGAAWFVVWRARRRAWLGLVAWGWFLSAVALAFALGARELMLIVALILFLLMALPGWVMMRIAERGRA